MVARLDVLSVMVITKSLRIAQNAYHISSIFIILTDILKAKPGDRFQTSPSSLTRWIHVVSALRWSSIPGQRQNSQNSCWKKSGEGWRSFKGHCVRSCPKDGEHRSQVRRRRRLLLLQVLPMPPPPVDVPTLILMWWSKEPYMMLLLFTTAANKTQVVHVSFVFKKPLASSRQFSGLWQLWYGRWNPCCR